MNILAEPVFVQHVADDLGWPERPLRERCRARHRHKGYIRPQERLQDICLRVLEVWDGRGDDINPAPFDSTTCFP